VKRRFRLTRSTDFKRVRSIGKSYAHPLVVLIAAPSEADTTRIGIAASRSAGGAVSRNRAKRLLREACRPLVAQLAPGKDIILIARSPISAATLAEVQEALQALFRRAHLEMDHIDGPRSAQS
jgi:ribonuclease P protein component